MRFLFGIFTGAALTLLIATTTNAPTSPVVEQINAGWQALIHTTSDVLFRQSTAPQTEIPAPRRLAGRESDEHPAELTSTTGSEQMNQAPINLPAAASAPPATLPPTPATTTNSSAQQQPVVETAEMDVATAQDPIPEIADKAMDPSPRTPETPGEPERHSFEPDWSDTQQLAGIADTGMGPLQPDPAGIENFASVWTPFHSERSAAGFANRLSEYFTHPFTVQRQGPGAYQVTFPYDSDEERDAMLLEIAEITGL